MQRNYVEEMPEYDPDLFFKSFWRKQPVLVRGGAPSLAGDAWTYEDWAAAHRKAVDVPGAVRERAGEVSFIEDVSRFVPELAERAAHAGALHGAPHAWFDAIRTYGSAPSAAGIGAHFDHSDNFVLQQLGTKRWTLASPDNLPRADIAARMLGDPRVGSRAFDGTSAIQATLEPGDLLYIPLFWLHDGVSDADSLSLSLVCPAVSLLSAVAPFLADAMRTRALGHQPLPALHGRLSEQEVQEALAAVRAATGALLRKVADDASLLDALAARQTQVLVPTPGDPA